MKAFKGNSYTAPIEKERKELGKNAEKLSQKYESDKGRISKQLNTLKTSFGNVPSRKAAKKKAEFNYCEYAIITLIVIIVMLLIVLVTSLIINPSKKDTEF